MIEGRCSCGEIQFRMKREPMFVHCCHCTDCGRESGTGTGLNAVIEADEIELVSGRLEETLLESHSGKGQKVYRCPKCQTAVWGIYNTMGPHVFFVRVGALENAETCVPNVQVYTRSKLPWVVLNPDIPAFEKFYSFKEQWPSKSIERLKAARERLG